MKFKLSQLSEFVHGNIYGNPDFIVQGLAPLDKAGPEHLSFLTNPKYKHLISVTKAGALLLDTVIPEFQGHQIVCSNPYLGLALIMQAFFPARLPAEGIHPQALIGENCKIDLKARICAGAVIGNNVSIGANSTLFPGVIVGDESFIGADCILYPNVVVYHGVHIGNRVIIHSNTVIGSDGFGYAKDGPKYVKIPQIGAVIIEDDVEIGACCAVDRGSLGNTVIKQGAKLDNLIQIAHNVTVGRDTAIAGQSGIAGSTKLGDRVTMAGQTGIGGHVTIGDDCTLTARTTVISSLKDNSIVSGYPAQPHRIWLKNQSVVLKALELSNTVRQLTEKIKELEQRIDALNERRSS